MNTKLKNGFFTFFFLVCFLGNIWPIAEIANHIEPMVLGLPFFIFWAVAWSFMTFIGVVGLYFSERAHQS